MVPYETVSLPDAVIIAARFRTLPDLRAEAPDLYTFSFATVDPAEAARILSTAEAAVCRRFHRTWREVRRKMQAHRDAEESGR